ncbi:MAG TPA: hypothetical protein VGF11_09065 [Acidimicrobiales bacterium]
MSRAQSLADPTTARQSVRRDTSSEFGVCRFCRGPTQPGYGRCFCCASVASQLGMPLVPVVSMTTYRLGDEMHRTLRRYKDAPSALTRHRSVDRCATMLAAFVDRHREGIEALSRGPWDTVVTVPSSTRPGRWPVDAVVSAVGSLAVAHRRLLVRGPERMDHLQPSRSGFVIDPRIDPATLGRHRALVVDDSYTTGARAQSAATALRLAGMHVGTILALGRVVAPRSCPWHAAFWAAYVGDGASGHKVGCTAPGWEREW